MTEKSPIKKIFFEAVEIETAESRERYLDEACDGDADLRQRVDAMLAAHAAPESYLERPAAEFQIEATKDLSPNSDRPDNRMVERPGSTIGVYKLLEQIGEGGMGVVFMAEQQKPVRRKVALKIIKPGMDTKQVIARFEAERQALAIMDHPNIAHVLEAGSTESGRPYFVMELVRGIPITEYCDQNKLPASSRLELFVSVCQAVQHAHTKGIIHRDIKPTNVLVTLHDGVPVPKIIDFGVAKATNQQLTERTLFTAFAQMVGTPLYMSPEQAEMSGLDVDTRSDIYSLGVLLYELLTGTTPFDRERICTAAYDEVRRIIREEEPSKPSTRVSTLGENSAAVCTQRSTDANRLRQLLRGELDWIVMTSLEKDRTRRYQTASALAEDVLHHLSGEAVKACPPTLGYRARKFVTRYKAQVAVASLFLLLLVVSSAVAWTLFSNARQARNEAIDATARALVDRENAVAAKNAFEKQKNRAEESFTLAEQERQRAESLAEQRQRTLYDYNLNKAAAAFRGHDTPRAVEFLEECHEEQRGWEWHRLHRLTEAERTLDVSDVPISFLDVSRVDSRIATVDRTGRLQLYDPAANRQIWPRDTGIESAFFTRFSGNGDLIGVTSGPAKLPGKLQVWEAATGNKVWENPIEDESLIMVDFSQDGQYLAFGSVKHSEAPSDTRIFVQLWDLRREEQVWRRECRGIPVLAFAPDANRLYLSLMFGVTFESKSRLCCWQIAKPTEGSSLKPGDSPSAVSPRQLLTEPEEIWTKMRNTTSFPTPTPDGSRLILGAPQHSLEIWDAALGKKIDELPGSHSDIAYYTVFGPDGRYVASRGMSGGIAVWDWHSQKELPSLRTRCDRMLGPAFTADGAYVVVGSKAGNAIEMRAVDPAPPQLVLRGHEQFVNEVSFSPDGTTILSASADGTLRTWSTATGQELKIQDVHTSANAVAFSPKNGDLIATGGPEGVKLWDAESREVLYHWTTPGDVQSIGFTPNGDRVAAGSSENRMAVWNVADGRELQSFPLEGEVGGLALSADGRRAYSLVRETGRLDVWNLQSGANQVLRIDSTNAEAGGLALHPNRSTIAAAINVNIELWDLDRKELTTRLSGHDDLIGCLAFNGDGSRLFSGDAGGVIKVWNTETGEQLLSMQAHEPVLLPLRGRTAVRSLAISPDGNTLASGGANGLVKLWETTRPADTIADRRRVVARATQVVNDRYRQSGSQPAVLQSLDSDDSLPKDVLDTAVEIAKRRGDRPWAAVNSLQQAPDQVEIIDVRQAIEQARQSLVDFVGSKSGVGIDAGSGSSLTLAEADVWRAAAAQIADPQFLSLEELNGLLNPLIEEYPRVHQFIYIRGLAHAGRGRWEQAEADLTAALSRVPEKTDLWHGHAFRLAFLYVQLGRLGRYQDLCEKTLADFGDTSDPRLASRTSKMCLFSSHLCVDMERAAQLADAATKGDIPPSLHRWYFLAQGIAEYRRGNWSSAIGLLHRSRIDPPRTLHRTMTFLYEALARERSGQREEARQALAAAEEIMKRDGFPQIGDRRFAWSWSDWINVQVVYEEAQQLLSDAEQSGDRPLPSTVQEIRDK